MNLSFLKQNTQQRQELILSGSISKTILLLSVPTLMMGIVQTAIPLIDGLFINNIAGTIAASAVSYCVPILSIIIGISQGLGSAGMALIGQANGRGEFKEGRSISAQLVILASLLGVILAPALLLLAFPISAGVSGEISGEVFTYLALNTLVIPFSFLESIYSAIKNSNGKPEATFIRMVILLVLKIIFNELFIDILKLGVAGAAYASLASNVPITVWMYIELFIKKGPDKLILRGFKFHKHTIYNIVSIGIPSILSNMMVYIGFFLIMTETEKFGTAVLNGQGIASNIVNVCYIIPASFGSAITTMVSMNVGAGQSERARKACLSGSLISAITALVLIAVIAPVTKSLTLLFTRNEAVLTVANEALYLYIFAVLGYGVCMVELGAFIGLGRTWVTLIAGVLRVWALRYAFILVTENFLGYHSIFWGNLFSNYITALITTILVLRLKWVSVIKYETGEPLAAVEADTKANE